MDEPPGCLLLLLEEGDLLLPPGLPEGLPLDAPPFPSLPPLDFLSGDLERWLAGLGLGVRSHLQVPAEQASHLPYFQKLKQEP